MVRVGIMLHGSCLSLIVGCPSPQQDQPSQHDPELQTLYSKNKEKHK